MLPLFLMHGRKGLEDGCIEHVSAHHALADGYPSRTTIRFIFNQGFPRDWMRWRLTTDYKAG